MKISEITKKVKDIIVGVLHIDNLPLNASSINVKEWDSLAYLTIVSKLEKDFKLKITQKNINNFNNIKNIIKEIKLCIKK